MAVTIYIMPKTTTTSGGGETCCKYFDSLVAGGFSFSQCDLGPENVMLVAVQNISGALDATISGDVTCTKIPPLGNQVGLGALATVKAKLETFNLPADWVTAGMTYGQVLKYLVVFCQILQCWQRLGGSTVFTGGVTLDTVFNTLPAAAKTRLLNVAISFGWSTAGLLGTMTLRQIFKAMADQWNGDIAGMWQ